VAEVYVVGSLNADHRVRVASIPKAGETILGSDIPLLAVDAFDASAPPKLSRALWAFAAAHQRRI